MPIYKKVRLGFWLLLLFMSTAFITGLVGFLGIRNMGKINATVTSIYNDQLLPITFISGANVEVVNHNRRLCIYVLLSERAEKAYFKKRMLESRSNIETYIHDYRQSRLTDKERALLAKFDGVWPAYMASVEKTLQLSESGKKAEAESLAIGPTKEKFQQLDDVLSDLVTLNKEKGKQAYEASNAIYAKNRVYLIVLVLVCVAVSLGVGLFMSLLVLTAYARLQ